MCPYIIQSDLRRRKQKLGKITVVTEISTKVRSLLMGVRKIIHRFIKYVGRGNSDRFRERNTENFKEIILKRFPNLNLIVMVCNSQQ